MTDIWPSKKRSEVMAKIRKTDSSPEILLRQALRRAKVRFRTYTKLPGTPDIVLESPRLAVFVHGCFWHGCPHHYRPPRSNVGYWSSKLERNKARDKAIARKVRAMGWHTTVAWECQLKEDRERVVTRILQMLRRLEAAYVRPRGTP